MSVNARLYELRNLQQRIAKRIAWILSAVLWLVLRGIGFLQIIHSFKCLAAHACERVVLARVDRFKTTLQVR